MDQGQLSTGPDTLKHCSFKLEVNDRSIYDLSQEEAIELIKSYEADPELKRYSIIRKWKALLLFLIFRSLVLK